jgi:hypothetical protein
VDRAQRCEKDRHEKKTSMHSRFTVSQFFIDENNELLYNVSQTGKETLCVQQVKRDHRETLRYKIFVELHDTPLMEHCGTTATTFALQARYSWPKLKMTYKHSFQHVQNAKPTKLFGKNLPVESKFYDNLPDRDNPIAWIYLQICHHMAQKNTTHYGRSSIHFTCDFVKIFMWSTHT